MISVHVLKAHYKDPLRPFHSSSILISVVYATRGSQDSVPSFG